MQPTRKLWRWLGVVFVLSFAALGWMGREIYLAAPPIPKAVVSVSGATLYTGDEIQRGQQAWLSAGGQQLGTVWGHGSYVAPDWSADWLHREAVALRERLAQKTHGARLRRADGPQQAAIDAAAQAGNAAQHLRRRHGDDHRVAASARRRSREVAAHYAGLFGDDPALDEAARAVRDDRRHAAERRRTAQALGRLLLLVVVGRHDRPARARRASPTPATGRTSRWSATR